MGAALAASACVLLYATNDSGRVGETGKERLRAMQETNDGLAEIARRDLDIRGTRRIWASPVGDAPRFADLARDTALLESAEPWRPLCWTTTPDLARQHVARWLGRRMGTKACEMTCAPVAGSCGDARPRRPGTRLAGRFLEADGRG